ncbi:MAG: 4-(cytidine 5'-diphospho)-2-C-methyl-D-erythritol kinase [Bacteroidales bacterium]|nr:4-(cytidine 5'-diphospho)-2-C-methyl-D-erythritol kinase [Bacteroidales bacterium]
MVVFPNAKINLGLAVTEKRLDGYHNLESIFLPITLCDVLEILPSHTLTIKNYGFNIDGNIEQNLCYKAFKLLQNDFNIPPVTIILHKNIPMGAGLGGGSSDAAFTLKTLNKLFELNLSLSQLSHYAKRIGSDCNFFIENIPAYATQKGDELNPISYSFNNIYIVILKKSIHIHTAEAYQQISPHKTLYSFKEIIEKISTDEWKNYFYNDFEISAFSNYPELKALKHYLYQQGAFYASMTGSGSAIYGLFKFEPKFTVNDIFFWKGKILV